jgi:hypothetical protein
MIYTDLRAKKIHQATEALQILARLIPQKRGEELTALLGQVEQTTKRLTEAEAMPAHVYECSSHGDEKLPASFQSPARTVYVVTEIVEHGEDGSVIAHHRFGKPVHFIECRECTEALHPIDYLKRYDE